MAFHIRNCVGTRDDRSFAVQWLACALPCRRFAGALAGVCARLGADVDRYSFTVRDLHPLLLAGLPAHSENLHNARNRCAIARCAGSPIASAVTGGKIVKTQNRCALVRPLRWCGLSANMVVTDRTVRNPAPKMRTVL